MKVTLILPAIGKKPNEKYLRSWLMEPLTIAVLSALLPADCEREFFDDRIESIDYDTDTDVVLITVETYTAKRAYFISDQFRSRGKKVVMGGYHATLVPDEVKEHCDAIMVNNCGENLKTLLEDLKINTLKKEYIGTPCIDSKWRTVLYTQSSRKNISLSPWWKRDGDVFITVNSVPSQNTMILNISTEKLPISSRK